MATMSDQNVVMVAERAVKKLNDDLRGEMGVMIQILQNSISDLKSESSSKQELEDDISNLNGVVKESFKTNNALLRAELGVMKQGLTDELLGKLQEGMRESEANLTKKMNELERNINITLENIQENSNKEARRTGKKKKYET